MPVKKPRRRVRKQRANRQTDFQRAQGIPVVVSVAAGKAFHEMSGKEKEAAERQRVPLTQSELDKVASFEGAPADILSKGERRQLDELKTRTIFSADGAKRAHRAEGQRRTDMAAREARERARATPGSFYQSPGSGSEGWGSGMSGRSISTFGRASGRTTPRPQATSAQREAARRDMIGGGSPMTWGQGGRGSAGRGVGRRGSAGREVGRSLFDELNSSSGYFPSPEEEKRRKQQERERKARKAAMERHNKKGR
jgi:hypothetical protein